MNAILFIAVALIILLTLSIAGTRKRQKTCGEAFHTIFDKAYAETEDKPSLQISYAYGMPIFKVTHPSRAAHEQSELSGANSSFRLAIQAACDECGSTTNPYDASRAIHFAWLAVGNELFFPSATPRDDLR